MTVSSFFSPAENLKGKSKMKTVMILLMAVMITAGQEYAEGQNLIREPGEPETDATSQQILNGLIASQRFGNSVAQCSDLNGDGYGDIAVGAHLTSSNTGRVYVYHGGNNMNSIADLILNGEATNNYFGISVSDAGDVNGDGYSDLIVGAYGYSSNTGRAYIYYGGISMDNVADVILTGPSTLSFGYSVSSAGDVNGDGYADVIVSGHTFSSNTGRAYIFYGGMNMDNVADKTLQGAVSGGFFGFSLSDAGDHNGDGFSDVIVGAYAVSSFQGRAYMYFGGANMDTIADLTYTGESSNNFFGQIVSDAGDVNSDGYSDLMISAPSYMTSVGKVYVYYGSGAPDNAADVTLTGESAANNFGRGISSAGDVNGDGYSDIVAGAQTYAGSTGKAYVYFGGSSMNTIPDMSFGGETAGSLFGFSVSGGTDLNGDGYSDMSVGAYGYSSNKGRVYIYRYSLTGNDIPDLRSSGSFQSQLGFSVSVAGDVNGDGFKDYVAGAPQFGDLANGRISIFFGSQNPDTIPDIVITGPAANSWFGWSVSGAGDFNADGYDDVIVGAPEYDNSKGRIYVYFGGSSMDTIADMYDTGPSTLYRLGQSVSSAGDLNGDGYPDIAAGAPGANSSRGAAYFYYGGITVDSTFDYSISGGAANEEAGACVANVGDLNGDGLDEVAVGHPGYDTGKGMTRILFGGFADSRTLYTGNAGARFGTSIAGAGDFNGDGFDDLMIGAHFDGNTGKAYLYYGNVYFDNSHDLVFEDYAEFQFAYSLSGAGDINNDGYDDVIIGEPQFGTDKGRVFAYFGGISPNNDHDILMSYNLADERLGYSVAGGDINGDGLSDIIAGANTWNASGACYLYLSSAPSVKPIFASINDVPNDQGGKVNLKWVRSSYDAVGMNVITDYLIQRSYPPQNNGFYWENIASVPATRESFYSFTDNTTFDSVSGNSGTLYYRITARTSNPDNFWRSAILSGRSIDNIAPLMVSPFTAVSTVPDVLLNWKRSTAPDLLNYVLYRSTSQTIDPDTEPAFATTTDSTYLDTAPLSGVYYYFVVAQDMHNNKSPVAVAESPNMTLNLTMFVEGMYNAASNSQVSDTITVELRNAVSPFAVADVAKAVAGTSGGAVLKFGTAPDGNYYFAVKHRNALETWSSVPLAFTRTTPASYNLTSLASQSYGSNMIQVDASPVRFAVYSGDVNQDETVDATDVSTVDNDAANFVGGYVVTDLTGDNFVDGTDFAIADNNAANFVSVIRP